jgi:hypothetical protein
VTEHDISLKRFHLFWADDLVLESTETGRNPVRDFAVIEQGLNSRCRTIYIRLRSVGQNNTRFTGFAVGDRDDLFKCQAFAVDYYL